MRFPAGAVALALLMILAGQAVHGGSHTGHETSVRCRGYMDAFSAGLNQAARQQAVAGLDHPARTRWNYAPGSQYRPVGIPLGQLSDQQRAQVHEFMRCTLSTQGYLKVTGIIQRDQLVRRLMDDFPWPLPDPLEIGSDFYWVARFDSDSGDALGVKIEGHHLSLNFRFSEGPASATPSVTPLFLGIDPAELEHGPLAGLRLLGQEEELAVQLVEGMTAEQKAGMSIAEVSPPGLTFKPDGEGDFSRRLGLQASSLSAVQRLQLWQLIREYTGNLAPDLAGSVDERIAADGVERVYLAWAGPWPDAETSAPREPFYYRIQGPSILIEFDHSGNILTRENDQVTDHIHTVMRIPGDDFSADPLRAHYRNSPHHLAHASGDTATP